VTVSLALARPDNQRSSRRGISGAVTRASSEPDIGRLPMILRGNFSSMFGLKAVQEGGSNRSYLFEGSDLPYSIHVRIEVASILRTGKCCKRGESMVDRGTNDIQAGVAGSVKKKYQDIFSIDNSPT
jgi:hypothetical protein